MAEKGTTVKFKNETIHSMAGDGEIRLLTEGRYMDGNVDIAVNRNLDDEDEGKVVSGGALVSQTSITVTENDTYDTTTNDEVVVEVENSYSASDEGKVVDGGELVAQGSQTVTENGTYDTTLISELIANIAGGGGGAKNILKGTAAPTALDGVDGDIYLQHSIPSDYRPVEFLTTHASTLTYVQIPMLVKAGDVYEYSASRESWESGYYIMFGVKTSISQSSNNRIANGLYTNKKRIFADTGLIHATEDPTITAGQSVVYGDTITSGKFTQSITVDSFSDAKYYLFYGGYASNSVSPSTNMGRATLKRANGRPFIDIIPCVRKSDSVCGFYDIVSDTFYTAVSGSFTAPSETFAYGDVVKTYCKVNGAWQMLEGTDIDDVNTDGGSDTIPNEYQKVDWVKTGSTFSCISAFGYDMRKDDVVEFYAQADDWTQTSSGKAYYAILGFKETLTSGSGARGWLGVANTLEKAIFTQFATLYGDNLEYSKAAGSAMVTYGSVADSNAKVMLKFSPQADAVPRALFVGGYSSTEYAKNTKIYKITVKRADGKLVMNLIPCYRKADSVVGMFETKTWRFITASSGTFTCGTDS